MIERAGEVIDAPPPTAALRVINPIARLILRTPISRLVTSLALLEFEGRRTGKRRQVAVGWHLIGGQPVVVTPAKWRANFAGEHVASVRWKGVRADYVGTLEADPDVVAGAINSLLKAGTA